MPASRSGQPGDHSPAACAAEALCLLRGRAYFADRVDWPTVTREVQRAVAEGADLAQAMRPAFHALGDRHSFLRPADSRRQRDRLPNLPVGRRLTPGIGYLQLPHFPARHLSPVALDYVEAAWTLLREPPPAAGWVLDLRRNHGGSIVPMLAAIGPLLGSGRWLTYRRRDGSSLSYQYLAGEVRANQQSLLVAPQPPDDTAHLPLAVLVDQHTASAAEGVFVACRARPCTRSFGSPTAGVPTGNAAHRLADGSLLLIATSAAVDRRGCSYLTALAPDQKGGLPIARAWLSAEVRQRETEQR
jgi:carboxyl-terminal processing protease